MSLVQERKKRIQDLFDWAKENNIKDFDNLLKEARKRWTYTTYKTLKSYTRAVLELIERDL